VAALALAFLAAAFAWRRWAEEGETTLQASGIVEATEVDVSFRIAGRLVERPVAEGQRISRGALVARLESRELEAEVERLQAALRASETRIPQLQTEIALQSELAAARRGGVLVRRADPREPRPPLRGHRALPAVGPRRRPVHLHHLAHPAAGR
jgi:HlyD family secretion protein